MSVLFAQPSKIKLSPQIVVEGIKCSIQPAAYILHLTSYILLFTSYILLFTSYIIYITSLHGGSLLVHLDRSLWSLMSGIAQ